MKLTLQNFRKWKRLEVELSDLTTITGPTDQGKSSILQALRWLTTNRPSGDSVIRRGAVFCRVTLELEDHVIVRHKGKKGNYYLLDGKKYNFDTTKRRDPPDDILDILNLDPTLNFQSQHSSPFWFSESAGEVSRQLNKIVALDLIDSTLANIAQEVKRARLEVELSEERLKVAQSKHDKLGWVEKADREYRAIEGLEEAIAQKRLHKARIEAISQQATSLATREKRLSECLTDAARLVSLWERVEEGQEKVESLEKKLRELEKLEETRCRVQQKTEGTQKELKDLLGEECPLCGTLL